MRLWRDSSLGSGGVDLLTADRTTHRYARHFHEEHAIAVFVDGAQRNQIGRHGDAVCTPGTVVLIAPGEPHTAEPGARDGWWSHRAFYPGVDTVMAIANSMFAGPELRHAEFVGAHQVHDPDLAARISFCHRTIELSADDPARRQQAFADVIEPLLLRYGSSGRTPRRTDGERASISRAIARMRERFEDSTLGIDELAGAAALSPFYFMRSFRATTGMTVHAFLVQLRLVESQKRLASGSIPSRVALECGFCDQSHLIRHFKSAFGVTPGQYAKSIV